MGNTKKNNPSANDIRAMRPIMIKEAASNHVVTLQQSEVMDIGGCEFTFYSPNNVSIFVNISKRELNISRRMYKEIIEKNIKKKEVDIKERELSALYNYFEHIQTCIICVYTAIEALANIAIPNEYEYKTINTKGVSESWNKETIERWFQTSEKYTKILPEILNIEDPKKQIFWSKFKELESIRNEIIHQKTSLKKPTDVDSKYLNTLLQPHIFETINAGFELITYICNSDQSHTYFPLGFGPAQIKIKELEDFSKDFKLFRAAKK